MMDSREELGRLREQIDGLDKQIRDLFRSRMDLSGKIAEVKMRENLPITDVRREEAVLETVRRENLGYEAETLSLMRTLMALSKIRQACPGSVSTPDADTMVPNCQLSEAPNCQLSTVNCQLSKIVLIGMPGCGKTTIAREVASRLGWPWFDSDLEIEEQQGMPVAEFFARFGEERFRELETRCVGELLRGDGEAVVSLGGGAVRNFVSVAGGEAPVSASLRQDCVIVYIHRRVEDILRSVDLSERPLLRDNPERLAELFRERYPLYEAVGDFCVHNEGPVEETVDRVLEALSGGGINVMSTCRPRTDS